MTPPWVTTSTSAPSVLAVHPDQPGVGALEERVLGLEPGRSLVVVDVARPGGVDLLAGQAGPLAGVALAQAAARS